MPNRRTLLLASLATLAAVGAYLGLAGRFPGTAVQASTATQTQAIVTATTAFLNTLTPDQKQKVQFPYTPQKTATEAKFARTPFQGGGQPGNGGGRPNGPNGPGGQGGPGGPGGQGRGPGNGGPQGGPGGPGGGGGQGGGQFPGFIGEQYGAAVWSNYPVSDVPRPGLRLGTLSPAQRTAAMHLLQVLLSPKGYQKVQDIMGSDQALTDAGTNFASGTDVYTIGVFGAPSATAPWMLEFGGHHLALNITMAGSQGVITPTLTGAQPSVYTANGKTVRVLAQENDKAFALLDALTDAQRKQAILNYRIGDLVLGPGQAGVKIQPEGLKASTMTAKQKALLLDVISEWAGIVNDAYATPRQAEIKSALDDTWFAWSGPTTHDPGKNGSSYYRIQGPKLVIEFSPQGVGGDPTMHVHTIYRDPTNDYGVQFTGAM